jgi:hypothetical protein
MRADWIRWMLDIILSWLILLYRNQSLKHIFSMVLPAHSEPRSFIQSRNHFSQTVGLLGRGISPPQGHYLHRTIQIQNKPIHTPNIHALSGIQTHDPSVQASEDNSWLRLRGYCERQSSKRRNYKFSNKSCWKSIPFEVQFTCAYTLSSYPCNRPWRPIGLWDVEGLTLSIQPAHRWR